LGTNTVYSDDNEFLAKYGYLYKYDERGNNIEKRLPGCSSISMVYDKANRLILSQDGNQRKNIKLNKKQWLVTKYDALGRIIFTGLAYIDGTKTIESLISDYRDQIVTESYTLGVGHSTQFFADATPLIVNYYDNYDFLNLQAIGEKNALSYVNTSNEYDSQYINGSGFANAKGLLTGSRTHILGSTNNAYLLCANYYDNKGQIVQSRSTNQLSGYDYVYNKYDFIGHLLKSKHTHSSSALVSAIDEIITNEYNNAAQLINTKYKIGTNDDVIIAQYLYDELRRPIQKLRHNNTDTLDVHYNIRNWTTKIKYGPFEEELYYNTNLPDGVTPCYNGNIGYSTWLYNGIKKGYAYEYDGLNRLTGAIYALNDAVITQTNEFNEYFEYDKMGNFQNIKRQKDGTGIDDLTFTYNGNQVTAITDHDASQNQYSIKEYQDKSASTSDEMSYDENGNRVKDLDRDIVTIQYNILNLPDLIQFKNGNQIKNFYAADGRKLGTEYYTQLTAITPIDPGNVITQSYTSSVVDQSGSAYIGNVEYKTVYGNTNNTSLLHIYNNEGYTDAATGYQYYYRKDHLGNNREVWCANTKATVQRTQYYPSGLPWSEGTGASVQEHKFNGKELIEMHGYDEYEFGSREYYPAGNTFTTMDPHAENSYSISPYAFCENNPLNGTDPNGQDYIWNIIRDEKTNKIIGIECNATIYVTGPNASEGRAKDLEALSNDIFKPDTQGGVTVSFKVHYEYRNNVSEKDLKAGENILTFTNETSDSENGYVNGHTTKYSDGTEKHYTGNTGIIYKNGNNMAVMHETGHMLGLPERYDEEDGGSLGGDYFKPHTGFKYDLMYSSKNKLLNILYYNQIIAKAKNINPKSNIINCYLLNGYSKDGNIETPYEVGGFHKKDSYAK
jgi:RHS repeat-associated protein